MTRYAVYGVPGLDSGAPAVAVQLRRAADDWFAQHPEITADARRYGFHATLKAPFALADGRKIADIETAVSALAAGRGPVLLPAVQPLTIGSFRALVPTGDTSEVDALAEDIVRALEPYRAPLTADDIARRRPEQLTPRQREILDEVGYPFALDEFRIHLTLTDALDATDATDALNPLDPLDALGEDPRSTGVDAVAVDHAIARHFAAFAGVDIPLTALAVFIEADRGAPFGIHSIHPFQEIA